MMAEYLQTAREARISQLEDAISELLLAQKIFENQQTVEHREIKHVLESRHKIYTEEIEKLHTCIEGLKLPPWLSAAVLDNDNEYQNKNPLDPKAFIWRLLDPADLANHVTFTVRNAARRVLGLPEREWTSE